MKKSRKRYIESCEVSETAEAVEKCNNKNVSVKVIKDAGHLPSAAAMAECFNALLQVIQ